MISGPNRENITEKLRCKRQTEVLETSFHSRYEHSTASKGVCVDRAEYSETPKSRQWQRSFPSVLLTVVGE